MPDVSCAGTGLGHARQNIKGIVRCLITDADEKLLRQSLEQLIVSYSYSHCRPIYSIHGQKINFCWGGGPRRPFIGDESAAIMFFQMKTTKKMSKPLDKRR